MAEGGKAPCFAVCALACDFSLKAECVHPFVRESERGPFVREVEKRDEKRFGDKIYGSSFARFFSFADVEGLQRTGKCMYIKAWRSKRNFAGSTGHTVVERGKAPVSPCVPLCAILLTKASVYPLSLVKANVGRLCEKLKDAMKSGLKQRCGGNFLAIVAGTILSEKLNFTGGFFEWRRPFDFSTDRL